MDKRIDCNNCPLRCIETDELCESNCSDIADFIDEIRAKSEAEHKAMCETCVHKVNAENIKQIRADVIEEVLKNIEFGIEATGHNDQYTTGFCNGLIWLKSCITNDEKPQFLEQLKGAE